MDHLYDALADLLEYPDEDWGARLNRCEHRVSAEHPDLVEEFLAFCHEVASLSVTALQELYTHTFDLNPTCALEIGYHIFGENYKRGVLLARLRETESPYALGQDRQLPDYLPVLLRLVVRLEDRELRDALIREIMIPAVNKMARALGESGNPYGHLLRIVGRALARDVGGSGSSRAEDTIRHPSVPELYTITSKAAVKR